MIVANVLNYYLLASRNDPTTRTGNVLLSCESCSLTAWHCSQRSTGLNMEGCTVLQTHSYEAGSDKYELIKMDVKEKLNDK